MKVSALKKNPANCPQTYENSGFNGIIGVCESVIFASNAVLSLSVIEAVHPELPNTVPANVLVNHRDRNLLVPSSQSQRSAKTRGTKESGRANSRLLEKTKVNRNHIGREQTVTHGAAAFQQRMKLPANRLSIESGDGKYSHGTIGLVKSVNSGAVDCTQTTLSLSPITKNCVSIYQTVGRFANLAISRLTPTGARL